MLKARAVASDETRLELRDAHQRVMSVAAVQRHLHAVEGIDRIDIAAYLEKLSAGIAGSMIGPEQDIEIEVVAEAGTLPTSQVVSLGLIVTELVINALKYAFPLARAGARILVTFEFDGPDWKLAVADNGGGRRVAARSASGGLGTAIVTALAKQLDARLQETSSARGLRVEVLRGVYAAHLPLAA